jgi:hypothetical protein
MTEQTLISFRFTNFDSGHMVTAYLGNIGGLRDEAAAVAK